MLIILGAGIGGLEGMQMANDLLQQKSSSAWSKGLPLSVQQVVDKYQRSDHMPSQLIAQQHQPASSSSRLSSPA